MMLLSRAFLGTRQSHPRHSFLFARALLVVMEWQRLGHETPRSSGAYFLRTKAK